MASIFDQLHQSLGQNFSNAPLANSRQIDPGFSSSPILGRLVGGRTPQSIDPGFGLQRGSSSSLRINPDPTPNFRNPDGGGKYTPSGYGSSYGFLAGRGLAINPQGQLAGNSILPPPQSAPQGGLFNFNPAEQGRAAHSIIDPAIRNAQLYLQANAPVVPAAIATLQRLANGNKSPLFQFMGLQPTNNPVFDSQRAGVENDFTGPYSTYLKGTAVTGGLNRDIAGGLYNPNTRSVSLAANPRTGQTYYPFNDIGQPGATNQQILSHEFAHAVPHVAGNEFLNDVYALPKNSPLRQNLSSFLRAETKHYLGTPNYPKQQLANDLGEELFAELGSRFGPQLLNTPLAKYYQGIYNKPDNYVSLRNLGEIKLNTGLNNLRIGSR